jgi:hypothetical protein
MQVDEGNESRATKREPAGLAFGCLVTAGLAVLVLLGLVFAIVAAWPTWSAHRRTPEVAGLMFQVELPAVVAPPFERFIVYSIDRGGPAVVVIRSVNAPLPTQLTVCRYPTGEVLEHVANCSAADLDRVAAERIAPERRDFDFDGDGSSDATSWEEGLGPRSAAVESGSDGSVLFESREPLEYESNDRLRLLGDLDGDGCSELAVLHPRMDRSRYDFEPLDRMYGAKSWLSVVSGKLATAAKP